MKLESESRSGSSPRQCECECWSSASSQCQSHHCPHNEVRCSVISLSQASSMNNLKKLSRGKSLLSLLNKRIVCFVKLRQPFNCVLFYLQDGDDCARDSGIHGAWHSAGDVTIKRSYLQQNTLKYSPTLVDSPTGEILQNHSSEESNMSKKHLRDSKEMLAQSQYDESDIALKFNDVKHHK